MHIQSTSRTIVTITMSLSPSLPVTNLPMKINHPLKVNIMMTMTMTMMKLMRTAVLCKNGSSSLVCSVLVVFSSCGWLLEGEGMPMKH